MEGKTETKYLYDAFISYRHVPLDKAVAVRLQELLEGYRPPKASAQKGRIKRIFRDQSELPGSGDLGGEIRQALMASEYLVVICSGETKKSAWCLEEIRQFKEIHEGRTDHILVVLTEGDPDQVFPEELLHETHSVTQEDGTVLKKERQIVPLSGDVRGDSIKQSLKALKTEFLRIAAPILGCRFDDLYQRHLRRKRRRFAAIMGGSFGLMAAVLAIVSVFAYRTFLSERNYRTTLADSYTRQGTVQVQEGKLQEALLYFSKALELEPETQNGARLGASLLLEQYVWPCLVRQDSGMIVGDVEVPNPPSFYIQAVDREGTCFLEFSKEGYALLGADGTEEAVPQDAGEFIGFAKDGSAWTFCNENQISCFDTETKEWHRVPRPKEVSPYCKEDFGIFEPMPAAFPVAENRIMVVYGGYVYLYEIRNQETVEIVRVDLGNVFPEEAKQQDLYIQGLLWVSDDKSLAVVQSGFGIAAFDTSDLSLKMSILRYRYMLNDVAFSKDGKRFVLAFGNTYGSSVNTPGGYLEIFNQQGDKIFETQENLDTPFEGVVFQNTDNARLLAWSSSRLHFYDIEKEEEYGVPVETETIDRAVFTDEEHCVCFDGSQRLRYYNLVGFREAEELKETTPKETLAEISMDNMAQAFPLGNGLVAAHSYSKIYLLKDTGEILDEVRLDYGINEMVVDADTGEVYLFYKYGEILYRTCVLDKQNCFDKIIRLNTRGEAVIGLYPVEGRMAALTGTNQILFYSSDKQEPEMVIRLKHNGTNVI